ncbi:MAG: hypothetical protein KA149_02140 [Chitinophagales bacterium]|nr:hypothetical protein [Chitinophagales bacterium]
MNKVVGVYETEEMANQAVEDLKNAGFAEDDVTVFNREDITNNHIHVKMDHRFEIAEIGAGIGVGAILGMLTGLGVFKIPGLPFLYNVGVIKGLFSGVIFGLLIGAAIALVATIIVYLRVVYSNEKHLNEGKFLVFYDGHRRADIKRAHEVLHTPDLAIELSAN